MNNIWIAAAFAAPENADTEGTELTSEPGQVTGQESTAVDSQVPPGQEQVAPKGNPWMQMAPFFVILIVIYFFMLRGPKKKQQQHQKMVQSLKKNDRVRTIGGIMGTVIDVRGDDITLKVDESNNTKIHVIPGAIATVMSDDAR
ncbi:MAG: preprotein translocase subunit YajC [Phycisphaerae bacterium]|nr:preprotein translocase subunit YajC [Phycisphaerae bacterium]